MKVRNNRAPLADRTVMKDDLAVLTAVQTDVVAFLSDGEWHPATSAPLRRLTQNEYQQLSALCLIEIRPSTQALAGGAEARLVGANVATKVALSIAPGSIAPMPPRQREEVLNVVLAERLAARGIAASPETISPGHAMPDVIVVYQGLRCAIEGKTGDVPHARQVVAGDARGRVETGIGQLAIGVVYQRALRTTAFAQLPEAMDAATFDFFIHTEVGAGEWRTGGVDAIGEELRRAHDGIVRDDVVVRAVEKIRYGMDAVAAALLPDPAVCDRLIAVLGIGEPSSGDAED